MVKPDYKQLYEEQKDKQIADGFKDLKGNIKEVRDEAKNISKGFDGLNDRVVALENKVFPAAKETIKQLPDFWRDTKVIRLFTLLALFGIIVAIIFAGLWGITLPKGLVP